MKKANIFLIVIVLMVIVMISAPCFASGVSMMQQSSGTSQGTIQRYIDISSPWSGAYVYENSKVVGTAEVSESFTMDNLKPGSDSDSQGETGITTESNIVNNPASGSGSRTQSTSGSGTRVLSESVKSAVAEGLALSDYGLEKFPDWFDLF